MIEVDERLDAPGSKLERLHTEGFGLPEAAKRLQRSPRTVYRLVRADLLPATKVGGRWVFLPEYLDAYVERSTVGMTSPGAQPGRGE